MLKALLKVFFYWKLIQLKEQHFTSDINESSIDLCWLLEDNIKKRNADFLCR